MQALTQMNALFSKCWRAGVQRGVGSVGGRVLDEMAWILFGAFAVEPSDGQVARATQPEAKSKKKFVRKHGYLGDCLREFCKGKSLRRDRATTNWD